MVFLIPGFQLREWWYREAFLIFLPIYWSHFLKSFTKNMLGTVFFIVMKGKSITVSKRFQLQTEVKWMSLATTDVGAIVEKPTAQNQHETGNFWCVGSLMLA